MKMPSDLPPHNYRTLEKPRISPSKPAQHQIVNSADTYTCHSKLEQLNAAKEVWKKGLE